jgi:hypothetical protein
MSDHIPVGLPPGGERLELADYRRDFRQRDGAVSGRPSWKLERRQHFVEYGNASWEAFRRGDWSEALRRLDEGRERLRAAVREEEDRGNPFHRVRVVEEPLTPYLHWELRSLGVQAECGRPIRVVSAAAVSHLEADRPLLEIVVLGDDTVYEVLYTEAGALDGAVRHIGADPAQRWSGVIEALYRSGEDVRAYVDSHVARLPAPAPSAE